MLGLLFGQWEGRFSVIGVTLHAFVAESETAGHKSYCRDQHQRRAIVVSRLFKPRIRAWAMSSLVANFISPWLAGAQQGKRK